MTRSRNLPILLPGEPSEFLVFDELGPCFYRKNIEARVAFRLPVRSLTREELDRKLASGDRRNGPLLHKSHCPSCNSCEPLRLDVDAFEIRGRYARILKRGDRDLRVEIGPPEASEAKVALYNQHLEQRGLSSNGTRTDLQGYRHFLVESCCESFELRYYHGDRLVGVAITDRGEDSLSAVYCYYDTEYSRYSLGTYSILKQLELCRSWQMRHLYLGLYVDECEAMAYKARFFPHERLIRGSWRVFEAPEEP